MFSGPRKANGVQGLRFIIQSEKAPHYLESRVEAFLKTMEKSLEDMPEEAFNKHIQALAIRRLDKPKKLAAECAKYWGEIISQQYNFDRGERRTSICVLYDVMNVYRMSMDARSKGEMYTVYRFSAVNVLCRRTFPMIDPF